MTDLTNLFVAALTSASVVGAGAAYFVTSTIDKELAQFENRLIIRLNGTYARRPELEAIEKIRDERYKMLLIDIIELQKGLNELRKSRNET